MRRKWTTAAVAVALTAAGVAAYLITGGLPSAEGGGARAASVPAATAAVTRQTLVDKQSHGGTLGFGDTTTRTTRLAGTVTALAATGSTVKRGGKIYKIDNKPVILLYGTLPAYRTLEPGDEGADVRQFEKNLWALGYRGFTVDGDYTGVTADAVEQWQDDLGLAETGTVELGRVVYATGAVRVASHTADTGAAVQAGAELLSTSATSRIVTVELDAEDQRLARNGAAAGLTLPDGTEVTGRITGVETTVEESENPDGEDTTKIVVTVGFDKAPVGLDDATVTVEFTASQRADVLTVPINALLALAEGGYGLRIVDGTATRIVAVETGLFADGRVEVTGDVAEGQKVEVPS
ncbi:peptidoglycan-binding protein [Actinoplanes derwentensis]|uniref:Multidrug efflux pump subunit AcrA (Membrane-fusion protein) n=1 Tax=Actinoplanes derwentensis TaxID=113562 RepID=A0A1H2CE77_9ACTN|nr:peptidoglycan-binding protein [Actinoplanes derwentensis]GID89934.1 peptidoglycan-binding protein [Actinoplanes derwentensis]SDT68547.1 Multidrug efflux pump subunit AcrA (membrane-fusion protein) [Actinoplanes derwentensis]